MLSESVKEIGYNAFIDCPKLEEIVIPKSVTNIGDNAFGCYHEISQKDNYAYIKKLYDFTIYGYLNTEAEEYAGSRGYKFVSLDKEKNTVSKITLDKAEYNIFVGDTATIKASVSPSDAADKTLNYKSDSTNIAKVSKSGTITAVAVGTATITASPDITRRWRPRKASSASA